jgi:signal transduction histidine kinase
MLPHLFEFGRTTKGSQGNGMGLWTVKHIVERHGGTIAVESVQGVGTTFLIDWPKMIPKPNPNRRTSGSQLEAAAV